MLKIILKHLVIPTTAVLVAACGGGGGDTNDDVAPNDGTNPTTSIDEPPVQPSGDELQMELAWLHDKMKTEYLFYDETPDLDYTQFESAEALLQQLIVADKDRFSYIQSVQDAIDNSNAVSSSFGMRVESNGEVLQVSRVYDGSSAAVAGIERADTIIRVGDVLISGGDSIEDAWTVAGNAATGATIEFEFLREGSPGSFTRELTRTEVSRQTVDAAGIITELDGTQTGYIYIYEFREKTDDELRRAFQYFQENNITSLVVDLRDNQGGRLETVNVLASLILLNQPAGSPFIRYQFSDLGDAIFRNGGFNTGYDLSIEPDAADIQRVHVISSGRTCSASEVLINSLRAYVDVQVTGVTSCGKPYGFFGRQFEEKSVLWALNFTSANARGEDDFSDGLAPTCELSDYEVYPFGDLRDPHLASALNYLKNDTCRLPVASSKSDIESRANKPAFNLSWQPDPEDNSL